MQMFFKCISTFVLLGYCSSLQYIAFDTASASSVYSGGGTGFEAKDALSTGASYWCSAGSHGLGQVVSWTGVLSARRQAAGLYLNWAYSPNEVQILTSPDGQNFVESACWRPSSQADAAYVEHIMFDAPVRAVTVLMRGPRAWGYFGLNSVALLAEPGPSMLVSGLTAAGGDMCAVGTTGRLTLTPCIEAIAAGNGNEIFHLTGDGLLMSAASKDACAALEDGDSSGGMIAMTSCRSVRQADDGRGIFHGANGQLRLALGNNCVVAHGTGLTVQECSVAEKSDTAADKFFFIAVPEFDPTFADAARASAGLAIKTASRLEGLMSQLDQSLPLLESCQLGQHLAHKLTLHDKPPKTDNFKKLITSKSVVHKESSLEAATNSMIGQLGVGGLADVISRARAMLSDSRGK